MKTRGLAAAIVTSASLGLLLPAQAQFWDFGNRQRYQQQPFGGWFDQRPAPRRDYYRERENRERDREREYREREVPVDYSRAPAPAQKKPEAVTTVVVVGDANADWLAYGLEEAFSERPEIGIVRKHRTDSGLIRYDPRRDSEWPTVAREIVAAEKPKFIVMMVGNHDRQGIRDRAPPATRPGAPKANPPPAQAAQPSPAASAAQTDPEQQASEKQQVGEQAPAPAPEQARPASYGPWEFRSEKWEVAYIRRVDATIAALKSAGVPVLWVGLPSQRGPKSSGDSSYLNEIYRSRAEKAGIVYVDIWDGFVDEAGRFAPQGPDYEGQIRRLRTGDGVYFTKFGARKLAHYVERELQRHMTTRGVPVALPVPEETGPSAKPGGPAQRPAAGPVVPLTASKTVPEELLGGRTAARAPATDATATRVLTKGEPIAAPSGRADDFSWPRASIAAPEPTAAQSSSASPAATALPDAAAVPAAAAVAAVAKPKPKRRPRPNYTAQRSPLWFQGWFR